MYVTVRYGEGQEEIFNPNCRSVSLLQSIRNKYVLAHEDDMDLHFGDVELSDESGNIKYLRDMPFRFASEVLNDRECLILLRVEKHDGSPYSSYTPLLKDDEAITEEFLSRLQVREYEGRPESRGRVKSNTRRSPGDHKDRSKGKTDRNRNTLKPEKPGHARSRSRQGNR